MTGVQVVTASQVQSIECTWQDPAHNKLLSRSTTGTHFQVHGEHAAKAQTLTKRNPVSVQSPKEIRV